MTSWNQSSKKNYFLLLKKRKLRKWYTLGYFGRKLKEPNFLWEWPNARKICFMPVRYTFFIKSPLGVNKKKREIKFGRGCDTINAQETLK